MRSDNRGITQKLVQNIFGSTIYKGLDVLFNFLLVRYAILFFGEDNYGFWLTLLSFFTWFSVVEFGISSSFRNKLTQHFADQKFHKIRLWIAKAYKASTLIYLSLTLVFIIVFSAVDYSFENGEPHFNRVVQISFVLYMLHYIFFFLHTVLLATHHTRFTYLITALQKGILLLGILLFIEFQYTPSLVFACLWFSAVPVLVWSAASVFSYRTFLKNVKPHFRETFLTRSKPLKHVQKAFFLIQICTLIIYATDNLIIINQLTGKDVTVYNVTFKYFNILIIIFNIVLLPYWSSFTEAAHKKDHLWIRKNIKRLLYFWVLMAVLALCMLAVSDLAYAWWIGKPLHIPFELSIFMGISVLITCWNNIFAYFLNSVSATKWQMNVLVISALINVPLSVFLLDLMGITGVIIATSVVLLPLSVVLPIHYRLIMRKLKN